MALCLAHTTAGYLAYEAVRPAGRHRPALLLCAVALANAPDADFLPGILIGRPGVFHRGVTHTLAAVVAILAVGWLVGRRRRPPGWTAARAALWAAAVYASHLLLDFITIDSRPPAGARFLWPLSDAYYLAPVTPLREIVIDPSGRMAFFRSLVQPHTLRIWLGEIAILVGGLALVRVLRNVSSAERAEPVASVAEGP